MNYSWWVHQTNTEQITRGFSDNLFYQQIDMIFRFRDERRRDELKAEIADLMKRP